MTVKTQTHAMFFCFVFLIFLNFLFVCLFAFFFWGGVLCFWDYFFAATIFHSPYKPTKKAFDYSY